MYSCTRFRERELDRQKRSISKTRHKKQSTLQTSYSRFAFYHTIIFSLHQKKRRKVVLKPSNHSRDALIFRVDVVRVFHRRVFFLSSFIEEEESDEKWKCNVTKKDDGGENQKEHQQPSTTQRTHLVVFIFFFQFFFSNDDEDKKQEHKKRAEHENERCGFRRGRVSSFLGNQRHGAFRLALAVVPDCIRVRFGRRRAVRVHLIRHAFGILEEQKEWCER